MKIDTTYLDRCIITLEKAHDLLVKFNPGEIDYNIYRSACIKEFEIILEQSGKLLRKVLAPYFSAHKEVDKLYFKDVFRQAVLHGLISAEVCERWLQYRDNRSVTTHDYGIGFAEETLVLLPHFISDAKELSKIINMQSDATEG